MKTTADSKATETKTATGALLGAGPSNILIAANYGPLVASDLFADDAWTLVEQGLVDVIGGRVAITAYGRAAVVGMKIAA